MKCRIENYSIHIKGEEKRMLKVSTRNIDYSSWYGLPRELDIGDVLLREKWEFKFNLEFRRFVLHHTLFVIENYERMGVLTWVRGKKDL